MIVESVGVDVRWSLTLTLTLSGHSFLRSAMAVEELGSRKGLGAPDGPQPGHHLGGGEEAEEEASDRLHVLQPEAPQLLGIQILLL